MNEYESQYSNIVAVGDTTLHFLTTVNNNGCEIYLPHIYFYIYTSNVHNTADNYNHTRTYNVQPYIIVLLILSPSVSPPRLYYTLIFLAHL